MVADLGGYYIGKGMARARLCNSHDLHLDDFCAERACANSPSKFRCVSPLPLFFSIIGGNLFSCTAKNRIDSRADSC